MPLHTACMLASFQAQSTSAFQIYCNGATNRAIRRVEKVKTIAQPYRTNRKEHRTYMSGAVSLSASTTPQKVGDKHALSDAVWAFAMANVSFSFCWEKLLSNTVQIFAKPLRCNPDGIPSPQQLSKSRCNIWNSPFLQQTPR